MQTLHWIQYAFHRSFAGPQQPKHGPETPSLLTRSIVPRGSSSPSTSLRALSAHLTMQADVPAAADRKRPQRDVKAVPLHDATAPSDRLTNAARLAAWAQHGEALVNDWPHAGEGRADALARLLIAATEAPEACQARAAHWILHWLPRLLAPVMQHNFHTPGTALSPHDQAAVGDVLQGFMQGLQMRSHAAHPFHDVLAQVITQSDGGAQRLAPALKSIAYFLHYSATNAQGDPIACRAALHGVQGRLYRKLLSIADAPPWNLEKNRMVYMLRDCAGDAKSRGHLTATIPLGALHHVLDEHEHQTFALTQRKVKARREQVLSCLVGAKIPKAVAHIAAAYVGPEGETPRFDWRDPLL